MQAGAMTALAAPSVAAQTPASLPAAQQTFLADYDYLKTAEKTATWIDGARNKSTGGAYWLPEPDRADQQKTITPPNTLYSGGAGIVIFYLQLFQTTGNQKYLDAATGGADYLAASWKELTDPSVFLGLSLYLGLAGTAFALAETWKVTKRSAYRTAAMAATDYIVQSAKTAPDGLFWADVPNIAADGSTILYLLYAAETFGNDRYRQVAEQAGEHARLKATVEADGSLSWRGYPDKVSYYPNFELGTAGVAYVLARLYRATREEKFLDAAARGAAHLQSIATVRGDAALIPYRLPDQPDLFYLGFCHGPAGTARLFYELHSLTKKDEYRIWTERLANGIVASGVPERLTPGYWNVACQCCGTAAIVDFFVGLWASFGRRDYLDFAVRVANQLASRQTNLDGKGGRWYQAWTRVKPSDIHAETGYSIGAAGIGAALLHVHAAVNGSFRAILLPDNPFAAKTPL